LKNCMNEVAISQTDEICKSEYIETIKDKFIKNYCRRAPATAA